MNIIIVIFLGTNMALAHGKVLKIFQVKHDSLIGQKELEKMVPSKVEWSPYFPCEKKIVTYGYMEEMDIKTSDAIQHSQPLYRVSFELPSILNPSSGTVEILREQSDLKYETQGVRPLSNEEQKKFDSLNFKNWVDSSLDIWKVRKKITGQLSEKDRMLFCLWAMGHGVLLSHLQKDHGTFFKSLNCFSKK